jgi:four helix bundle protein
MNPRNLRAYSRARELVALVREIVDVVEGHADLKDQGRRAASSALLNLAEGCGRRTEKDRRRFFDMAKGSAYEVVAVADVAFELGLIDAGLQARVVDVGDKLGGCLYRMR